MNKKEVQNISVHIKYTNEMTVFDVQDSLSILNEAFCSFYEKHKIPLSEFNETSPKVASVSEGSVVVDVIVPISCALIPILYDIIKRAFSSKKQYLVNVGETRATWTDEDNYEISKAVLKEYALEQSQKSVEEFMSMLSLSHIYKRSSIRAKIQNTKQLMSEQSIPNSLSISPLKNYSKAHRIQFAQARKDLNI